LHDGPVAQREHGLRLVGGERAQAGALPASHDHRLHRRPPRSPLGPGRSTGAAGPRGRGGQTLVAIGIWFLVSSSLWRPTLRRVPSWRWPSGVADARPTRGATGGPALPFG